MMVSIMKKIILTTLAIIVMVFVLPTPSFAQVNFRRPIDLATAINSYFDNNLSITGTQKYDCSTSTTKSDHQGVDFPVPIGTPVIAAGTGRIYYKNTELNGCPDVGSLNSNCGDGFGNHYRIDHAGDTRDGSGLVSIYAHMKNGTLTIPVGTAVACGQQVGQSASSGSSSGPHLHFETRTNGIDANTKIDPYIGQCSHLTPPSWTAVSNGQPTTQCDNRPLAPSNVYISNPTTSSLVVNFL